VSLKRALLLHIKMPAGKLFLTAVYENERPAKSVVILGTSSYFLPSFPSQSLRWAFFFHSPSLLQWDCSAFVSLYEV